MLKKKVEIEELDFLIDIEKWRRKYRPNLIRFRLGNIFSILGIFLDDSYSL